VHEWIVAIFAGFIGGIFDSLLRYEGFVLPHRYQGNDGRTVIAPGFVGNLLIGGGAGFIVWGLSANAQFSDTSLDVGPIINAFISGAGGSEVLGGYVRQKAFEGTSDQAAKSLDEALLREERLREELIRKNEEIQRLKEGGE
jgi:hypothetical protein